LREAKYPPDFKVIYYRDATTAITRFLVNREFSLADAADRIARQPAETPTEIAKRDSNALAVRRFAKLAPVLTFDGLASQRAPTQGELVISSVTISVRPEISLSGQYGNEDCAGVVKLHFSKTTSLDETAAGISGAILKRFSDGASRKVHNRHLVLIDVFAGVAHSAPRAVVSRGHELEAMCNEIAAIWPTI
jgi:hypothetical protein